MFITALTSAGHLSLSWASSIQSIPPHHTTWRSILIISSHLRLGLPSGLFPSDFPTKTTANNNNNNIVVVVVVVVVVTGNGLNEQTLSPLAVGLLCIKTLKLPSYSYIHVSNGKATGCLSPRRKHLKWGANHLSQFCAEVKVWNNNSTHPYVPVAWCFN